MNGKLMSVIALTAVTLAACSGSVTMSTNPSGDVSLTYTPCTGAAYSPTLLVAVQDGTGPWTVLTPAGGAYSATIHSTKVGVLLVSGSGNSDDVNVVYALASEVQQRLTSSCVAPLITATGMVNSLAAGETATIGVGWNSTSVSGPGNKSFSVSATNSTADLLAVLSNAASPAAKFIVRRGTNATPLAAIDFTTSEAFAPATPALTITGTGSEAVTFAQWYQTAAGFRDPIVYGGSSTTLPTTYIAMPATKQLAGDLHESWAYTASATSGGVTSGRTVISYGHDPVSRTLAFAALPTAPTITVPTTSPYPRFRVQWQRPTGHAYFYLYFSSGNQEGTLTATAGYLGGSAVDLEFPDLAALAGWQSSWMPAVGVLTNWGCYDYAFNLAHGPFDAVTDGLQEQYNNWHATLTP
jgi:hypothetical protein